MKVLLDGRSIENAGSTLDSALDAIRAELEQRMVIDVLADGRPVPPEHLDAPPADDPYAEELAFKTTDPVAIVKETLHEAADLLGQIDTWQEHAGGLVQAGELEQAMKVLTRVIEGWGAVRKAAELTIASGVLGEGAATDNPPPITDLLASLVEELTRLKQAFEQQDWAGVADSLSYDLGEQARRWRQWLDASAQALAAVG